MARVLVVGKGPPERGGIATFLQQLVEQPPADHHLDLLNLTHDGERQGGRLTTANLRRTLRDVWHVARSPHIDVVHFHSALAPHTTLVRAGAICLAARVGGRRVVLHAHGGRLVDWASSPTRRRLLRMVVRSVDEIIVVSEGLVTTMKTAGVRNPVTLIGNGVDTERFQPSPKRSPSTGGPPTIVYVGHLSRRKGVLDLLDASRRLEVAGTGHRLVLVGGVPDEGDVDRDAIEAARTESTEIHGPVDPADMPDVYARADVFCLPSWWEAAPLSVLEAMSSGVPVVGSDVGDIRAMVDGAGWIVPAKHPGELAAALTLAIDDHEGRTLRGEQARRNAVDRHALAETNAAIGRCYDRVTTRPDKEHN